MIWVSLSIRAAHIVRYVYEHNHVDEQPTLFIGRSVLRRELCISQLIDSYHRILMHFTILFDHVYIIAPDNNQNVIAGDACASCLV